MIITLASSKGGVGKSTITGCLAGVWAADGDKVHIVDLDNNRTVSVSIRPGPQVRLRLLG